VTVTDTVQWPNQHSRDGDADYSLVRPYFMSVQGAWADASNEAVSLDVKHRIHHTSYTTLGLGCRYFPKASLPFGQYQIILPGDRGTCTCMWELVWSWTLASERRLHSKSSRRPTCTPCTQLSLMYNVKLFSFTYKTTLAKLLTYGQTDRRYKIHIKHHA